MKESKKKILAFTGLSEEVFETIRFEWNMFLVRLNAKINPAKANLIKRIAKSENIKLNIGAGPFGEKDWVNIDMFMYNNITFTYDCRKKIPLNENSVSVLRCEHVLEHMDKTYEAPIFLKESLRVLRPGGVIRIIVPDIQKFIDAYINNTWPEIGFPLVNSKAGGIAVLNHTFRQNGEHKYAYDIDAMTEMLQQAGFTEIHRTSFGNSLSEDLKNDQPNHKPYSMYVEAVKRIS